MLLSLHETILFCFVFLTVKGNSFGNKDIEPGNYIHEEVEQYLAKIVSRMTEKYVRDIHDLRQIIDSQGRQIKFYTSVIRDLEARIESIEKKGVNDDCNNLADSVADVEKDDLKIDVAKDQDLSKIKPNSVHQGRIRRTNVGTSIAFFASMVRSVLKLSANDGIVFDNVVTNVGNAYNKSNGTFISPVPGTYVISVALGHRSVIGSGCHGHISVNGVNVAELLPIIYLSSHTIVLKLKARDVVSVENGRSDCEFRIDGTFSGFLLYEDVIVSPVVG